MISKIVLVLVLATSYAIISMHASFAMDGTKRVTPYGAYCSRISHYGMHKSMIDLRHAVAALEHYYGEKGLGVEVITGEGRFLKAKVKDGDTVVDTIIFDRSTGRVRSIY